MDNRKLFIALLKPLLRQQHVKKAITEIQYGLTFAGVFSVLVILTARAFVIPHYREIIWLGCTFILLIFIIRAWIYRPKLKDAVHLFNDFVPDDYVITAYSFLGKKGLLEELQLSEALTFMKREQVRVLSRKKSYFKLKWLLLCGSLFLLSLLLSGYFPNQSLLLAEKKEHEIAVVKKVEKQLKEKVKKEENPNAKKALEKALEVAQQKNDPKEVLKELTKQMKELELKSLKEKEKQNALNTWKEELNHNNLKDLASALDQKDIKNIMKELERMNKRFDSLTEDQKRALGKLAGTENKLSDQALATLEKMIREGLNAGELQKALADAQNTIANESANLAETLRDNGIPAKQIALNPANPNNGSKGENQSGNIGNNENGGTGQNSENGNGNSPNNGNGNGNGAGNGNGNGNGNRSGNGAGNGAGGGKSAGTGMGSRDLLTVPEKLDGRHNLETDQGKMGNGSPANQYESDGPILKGTIRSYQEVYGNYLESYRKSTDRVKLPADLEQIVKNYFTTLDPNKE